MGRMFCSLQQCFPQQKNSDSACCHALMGVKRTFWRLSEDPWLLWEGKYFIIFSSPSWLCIFQFLCSFLTDKQRWCPICSIKWKLNLPLSSSYWLSRREPLFIMRAVREPFLCGLLTNSNKLLTSWYPDN